MRRIAAYAATLAALVALDAAWLTSIGVRLFQDALGDVLSPQINFTPAGLFYVLYAGGVVFFAVEPALREGLWLRALGLGALFGFFCYATYDLTNYATIRNWNGTITGVDMAWGTTVTALSAAAGYAAGMAFARRR